MLFHVHSKADGSIQWSRADINRRVAYVSGMEDGTPLDVEIRKHREKRSLLQNSYLHFLLHLLGEHIGYDDDEIKEAMKFKFLRVYGETELPTVRKTSKLDTKEMTDFIDNIKRFGAEMGVYLPDAGEAPFDVDF